MVDHVLAPDVDDERDPRPERDEVGEVLIGSDTDVHAAGAYGALELRDHVLKRSLVRDEVVGPEKAARLREVGDQPPERRVAQTGGNLWHRRRRPGLRG